MKIEPRHSERTLADSGNWRAILLYGEDAGLIRERAIKAARQIVDDMQDPFRLTRLEGDEQGRVEEEMMSLSLVGGRRVVWVSGAQDSLVSQLERIMAEETDTLLIMEAGSLSPRSRLRSFAEKQPQIASIACYPEEGRTLEQTIQDSLQQDKIRIERSALHWLQSRLGADRALVRSEIEKLRLYARPGDVLELDDVRQCVDDSGGASLEEAVYQAFSGSFPQADLSLTRALADGAASVAYARAVFQVADKLSTVLLAESEGQSRHQAISALRPPLFFKRKELFQKALQRFSLSLLDKVYHETQNLEMKCKLTGAVDILLCQRHIMFLSKIKL
ncbi:DNA polymerase III subunit delta [Acetobacteraceae bacterium ESL0709]|nr:DNA polymerase III subunit delta [Acetobacteraceae bacterium ESL0697]MDF7678710.1 DNA polymerase III subunit delta [Acetobacteraceae bacterium ESL0709]